MGARGPAPAGISLGPVDRWADPERADRRVGQVLGNCPVRRASVALAMVKIDPGMELRAEIKIINFILKIS